MAYPADFSDAHGRYWEDAELLFGNSRWANADQMYGFSAECGLKAVMKSLGMPVDATTGAPTAREHLKHVQVLWPTFTVFLQGPRGSRCLPLLPGGAPFADWSHNDRYAHRGHFQEANVNPHRRAARAIRAMVQKLTQDGLL